MIKLRNARYCNLKLLLIFLVVFGHAIEPGIGSDPALRQLYRLIYLFHMPLFVFVSGLFVKTPGACLRQLRRLAPVYLLCQTAAVALGLTEWHTPWWIYWYLLSLCCWLALSWLLMKWRRGGWIIFVLSLVLGCLAGRMPVGRWMSLSRTIVFFPWFWLGTLISPETPWHRLRIPSLGALALLGVRIPVSMLYQAGPCDPVTRLACYGCAAALSVLVLSWCPRRRLPWTKAGADTLGAYLLHGPVLWLLPPVRHPLLFTTFYLWFITQANRWRSAIGITGKEECPWPDSKISTKPRASRSTGSSWP